VLRASPRSDRPLTALSCLLRERGWIVPAYTLPANAEHISVLRMVVKENFSRDMVDMLAHDLHTRYKRCGSRPRCTRTVCHAGLHC
jgi:glutamate decarboxylase